MESILGDRVVALASVSLVHSMLVAGVYTVQVRCGLCLRLIAGRTRPLCLHACVTAQPHKLMFLVSPRRTLDPHPNTQTHPLGRAASLPRLSSPRSSSTRLPG